MCTVADVSFQGTSQRCALVKGSPEALKPLLASVPANYDAAYTNLAAEGIRVLALASKEVPAEATGASRQELESKLEFRGFVSLRLDPETPSLFRELGC